MGCAASRTRKSADIGRADAGHVQSLRAEPLLPIQQLIEVDRTSPLYNEGFRRGMFYAESWALVRPSTRDEAEQYPFEGEVVAVEILPNGYVPPPVHG